MNTSPPSNQRILVIDDNRTIHEDFRKILVGNPARVTATRTHEASIFGDAVEPAPQLRFQIDSAFQGAEGLSLVERALRDGPPYAVAFVDVRMPPGWDGIETTRRLWEAYPDLQVVLCTAYSDYSWEELAAQIGQSDRLLILKKPFDVIEVLQLASALTEKWRLLQLSKRNLADLERAVVERSVAVLTAERKYRGIFESSPEGIYQTTLEGRCLSANPALARLFGFDQPEEFIPWFNAHQLKVYAEPERRQEFLRRVQEQGEIWHFESEVTCRDGSRKWVAESARVIGAINGTPQHYQGFVVDITARKQAEAERGRMEVQLRQAQKLESIGRLAAGIAHEINTPTQFIGDNTRFVRDGFAGLEKLFAAQEKLLQAARDGAVTPNLIAEFEAVRQASDLSYLETEIPTAIAEAIEGVERVSKIVHAMKEFSHPGAENKTLFDLNKAIESTVTVCRNEWKYVAELATEFDPHLPAVPVIPGEFNQVILNLVINAAHAIGDAIGDGGKGKGRITVSTRRDGDWVEVRIRDTGTGIPENIRHRIFDPFFTTKEVGKGSGQGLAIARSVVVDRHGGTITFETELGKGTCFIIRLPILPPPSGKETAAP